MRTAALLTFALITTARADDGACPTHRTEELTGPAWRALDLPRDVTLDVDEPAHLVVSERTDPHVYLEGWDGLDRWTRHLECAGWRREASTYLRGSGDVVWLTHPEHAPLMRLVASGDAGRFAIDGALLTPRPLPRRLEAALARADFSDVLWRSQETEAGHRVLLALHRGTDAERIATQWRSTLSALGWRGAGAVLRRDGRAWATRTRRVGPLTLWSAVEQAPDQPDWSALLTPMERSGPPHEVVLRGIGACGLEATGELAMRDGHRYDLIAILEAADWRTWSAEPPGAPDGGVYRALSRPGERGLARFERGHCVTWTVLRERL